MPENPNPHLSTTDTETLLNIATQIMSEGWDHATLFKHIPYLKSKREPLHGALDESGKTRIQNQVERLVKTYENRTPQRSKVFPPTKDEFVYIRKTYYHTLEQMQLELQAKPATHKPRKTRPETPTNAHRKNHKHTPANNTRPKTRNTTGTQHSQ